MRLFVCVFYLMILSLTAQSQNNQCTNKLIITILDSEKKLPIEGVTVYITGEPLIKQSDSNGIVQIDDLCSKQYEIEFRHLNHKPYKDSITILKKVQEKSINLNCHIDTLKSVIIKGRKSNSNKEIFIIDKLKNDDLFKYQGFSIGKSLEKINGVYNISTGNNIQKPVIRGLYGNRVLIIHNDVRQEGQQWGNEHAPEIDAFSIKEIKVIKGTQSIEYGNDALGGVILLNPNSIYNIQKTQGELLSSFNSNGNGFANSLQVEGNFDKSKKLSWRLQGEFKKSGNNKTPDYFLKNTGLEETNISTGIAYNSHGLKLSINQTFFNSKIGIFSGSHIGNLNDLYKAFNSEKPIDSSGFNYKIGFPFQSVNHQTTKAELGIRLKKLGVLTSIFSYQKNIRKEYEKNISLLQSDGKYKPSLSFLLNTYQLDMKFLQNSNTKWKANIGISSQYQTNEYFSSYLIPNYQKYTNGIYIIENINFDRLAVEGGLRFDVNYFTIQKWEKGNLIERLHLYKGIASSISLKYPFTLFNTYLNFSTSWRAPFVNELYSYGVHHSAASFEIGNDRLIPERSYQASLGAIRKRVNNLDFELSVYNNYVQNFIQLTPITPPISTIKGVFPTFLYSQSDVDIFGLEISLNIHLNKKINWYNQGNFLSAFQIANNKSIYGMPPGRINSEIKYQILKNENQNINISFEGVYTMKQKNFAEDYVPSPKAYLLLNADLLFETTILHNQIKLNLGVQNLLNKKYRDYLNRNRYFADDLGRNFSVRLLIPFTIKK